MRTIYISFISLLTVLFCPKVYPGIATANPSKTIAPEKILLIKVFNGGISTVGRDTLSTDYMAVYLQDRLFKSYKGTGEMPEKIKLERSNSSIPDAEIAVAKKQIQEAQRLALTDLCLLKYKRLFDAIDKRQQDKLKKQFPVLFQTDFQ